MTIEMLKARIAKAEEKIEKKQGTIARMNKLIEKKEAQIKKAGYTVEELTDYHWSGDQKKYEASCLADDIDDARESIRNAEKEIAKTTETLGTYTAQLQAELEKEASRNIPAILEFLDSWKVRVTEYYLSLFEKYPAAWEQYMEDMSKFDLPYHTLREMRKNNNAEYVAYDRRRRAVKERFEAQYKILFPYIWSEYNPATQKRDCFTFATEELEKDLEHEAKRKYDFIIERTNAIVGTITDATSLSVGSKGDLNGVIIGTAGKASVQTIGAGGYNIQCFHFRTLINRVKA